VKYDPPRYARVAKIAHIFGNVHLKIVPNAQTGFVQDVELLSGHPLLGHAAVDAAKKWQFSPGTQSGQPVEAVLKFSVCPDK
jgi:TonB family protein